MPAAKHGQIGTPGEVNGYYANVKYLDSGHQQCYNNLNGDCWEQRNSQPERQFRSENFGPNNSMKKWMQREGSADYSNSAKSQEQQHTFSPREFRHKDGWLCSDNNCLSSENGCSTYNHSQPFHSHSEWSESATPNEPFPQGNDFNQFQMYEKYPFCSSFKPSTSVGPRICCNDNPQAASPNTDCVTRMNQTSSDVFLPLHHGPKSNSRVCTQQPRSIVERMSQVDHAIEHCRQAEAQQFHSYRQGQTSNHFTDQNAPVCFNFEQGTGERSYPLNRAKESRMEFSQMNREEFQPNNSSQQSQYSNCNGVVVGDCSESNTRYSVSSDPEIYTKTPSVAKLNAHIQKLREEMLALRSTTLLYKQHMEKIFDDLKIITRMNDGKLACVNPEITYRDFIEQSTTHRKVNNFPSCDYSGLDTENDHSLRIYNAEEKITIAGTIVPSPTKAEKKPSRILPSYENVMDARLRPQAVKSCADSDNNVIKRNKGNERPNSDPFSLCIDAKSVGFSSTPRDPVSTMSLPHNQSSSKYPTKSAGSSLESEAKRTKAYDDQLRILPVLSKSNAALHISECSIDSGYQGSSATSPRDRQGRDPPSQAVTPASPLGESPVQPKNEEEKMHKSVDQRIMLDKDEICLRPSTESPNGVIASSRVVSLLSGDNQTNKINSFIDDKRLTQNMDVNGKKQHSEITNSGDQALEAPTQPSQIVKLKSFDGPSSVLNDDEELRSCVTPMVRKSKSSTTSSGSEDLSKPERPVPKQRTVFTLLDKPNQILPVKRTSSPNITKPENNITIHNEIEKLATSDSQVFKQASTSLQSTEVSQDNLQKNSNCPKVNPLSIRPTPPHRLTVIGHTHQTTSDTGSPVQNRVKLGVSSIKQYAPNSESKEGLMFYCTGQASNLSDAEVKLRKTANTKQLLREKFAAVVENSSSSTAGGPKELGEDDKDSSMIRRRSMRMMTEFQIFDFKGSMGKIVSPDAGDKFSSKPNTQIKPKYLSSSVSNRLAKSTSSSSYSVSPSAATVSKEIFASEKNKKATKVTPKSNSLRNLKPKTSEPNTPDEPKNFKNISSSYSGKPLPSPPPSPPRSPPVVAGNPPHLRSSQVSLFSEADLAPQCPTDDAFSTPLIRPKASFPGVSCDVGLPAIPKTPLNGFKISSKTKSAFTPVLSASTLSLTAKSSPVFNAQEASNSDEAVPTDLKRRVSLPTASMSNKQRFLNEFMPNSSHNERNAQLKPSSDCNHTGSVHRQSSLRISQKNIETVSSIAPESQAFKSGHNVPEKSDSKTKSLKKQPYTTTEPLFSEIPKFEASASKETERRHHGSCDKVLAPSSSNDQLNLECQPVRFIRKDGMVDVIGKLRKADFTRNKNNSNSFQQDTKVSRSNENDTNEDGRKASHTHQSSARPARPEDLGLFQPFHKKSNSSSAVHQYEIIRPADGGKVKTSNEAEGHHHASSQEKIPHVFHADGVAIEQQPSPTTRSHKSTVAIIKASLLGKHEKRVRSTTAEGKRDGSLSNELKFRSASVGAKKKTTGEVPSRDNKLSAAKLKNKDSKSKKSKHDPKQHKERSSAKKSSKDQSHRAQGSKNQNQNQSTREELPFLSVLPDASARGYNDPDSEAMERFLAAATASHTPRSPLQRLRSSFRVPKNKTKLMNSSRIKDDMDVARLQHPVNLGSRFDKTFPQRQEFTYV